MRVTPALKDGADRVFNAAARIAESGKIMGPQKILCLAVEQLRVEGLRPVKGQPFPEGVAHRGVENPVAVPLARAGIAGVKLLRDLPAAGCGDLGAEDGR